MNERIRHIREAMNLSRASFGQRIGVSGDVINNLERGRVEIKESMIKLICTVFNVREEWLRTGEGEMYSSAELFSLDRFVAERGATELELAIVKAYFELDPAIRQAVLEHFRAHLTADPDELEAEAVKQEYLRQKKAGAASSATAGQNGGEKMA